MKSLKRLRCFSDTNGVWKPFHHKDSWQCRFLNPQLRKAFKVCFFLKESIFLATEGSSPRDRLIWGSSRAFFMHLLDKQHQPALVLRRPLGCHCFCFPIKRQSIEVWLHSGILLGIVQEQFSFNKREFVIESERGEILYRVVVSLGNSLCMAKEQHFRVRTSTDEI